MPRRSHTCTSVLTVTSRGEGIKLYWNGIGSSQIQICEESECFVAGELRLRGAKFGGAWRVSAPSLCNGITGPIGAILNSTNHLLIFATKAGVESGSKAS